MPFLKFDRYISSLFDNNQTSYQHSNSSKTSFYSYQSNFLYTPNRHFFNRFAFDGAIKTSNSDVESILIQTSGTQNVTNSILYNDFQKYGVNISIPSIPIFITSINSPLLRLETQKSIKTDKNITNSTDNLLDKILLDNASVFKNLYTLDYSIFSKVKTKNNAKIETGYYQRNKIASSTGSLYKKNP